MPTTLQRLLISVENESGTFALVAEFCAEVDGTAIARNLQNTPTTKRLAIIETMDVPIVMAAAMSIAPLFVDTIGQNKATNAMTNALNCINDCALSSKIVRTL